MDFNTIQPAIATLGFPIVIAILLLWFIYKLWNKSQEQNEVRENKLYDVISKAQEQNEKLSKTNAEFVSVLTAYKSDLDVIKTDVNYIKSQIE